MSSHLLSASEFQFVAKSPEQCSKAELRDFEGLVRQGGEVAAAGLTARITRAFSLVFMTKDDVLHGVAALKVPVDTYRARIAAKSGVPLPAETYPFEFGWIFIVPAAREQHLSRPLTVAALAEAKGAGVFATSRTDNVRVHHVLAQEGFTQNGAAYASDDDHELFLFVRPPAGTDGAVAKPPEVDPKTKLARLFERKPLVMVRFDDDICLGLRQSRDGLRRFTVTQRHAAVDAVKVPTLCIAELTKDGTTACYLGVLRRKDAVSTFDSRLGFVKLRRIPFGSLEEIGAEIDDRQSLNRFNEQVAKLGVAIALTPRLSSRLLAIVWSRGESVVREVLDDLPGFVLLRGAAWQQKDAADFAKAVFGLSAADVARSDGTDFEDDFCDAGAHLYEDNVIAHDASVVPGYELIAKYVTGRSVFKKNLEQLVIYTANRGPLEKMLGVDLIYINETQGNIVMVQYKMLDEHRDPQAKMADWIFRPDPQLTAERVRMNLPAVAGVPGDYRLSRQPFYFKFVKRKHGAESDQSLILSLDHFDRVLADPALAGPRGGVKVSFDALAGHYLREADLIGLIRSGYVGTHRVETDALAPFLEQVNQGKRGLVLAWQHPLKPPPAAKPDSFL